MLRLIHPGAGRGDFVPAGSAAESALAEFRVSRLLGAPGEGLHSNHRGLRSNHHVYKNVEGCGDGGQTRRGRGT